MAFTKINAAGIGTTETVTVDGLTVINDGSFGGNLSVGGTITYEDVTNVDSVGIITARAGVLVGSGITLSKDGDGFFTGVVTATSYAGSGANLTGIDTDLVSDTSPQLGGNLDSNGNEIVMADNDKIKIGTGSDLQLYHTGSHSYIADEGSGELIISGSRVQLMNAARSGKGLDFVEGSSGYLRLYQNNSIRLETTSSGVSITGNLSFGDNHYAMFGAGNDLQIYHSGTDTFFKNQTGSLNFFNSGVTQFRNAADNETLLKMTSDGSVELYYDNSKKFETTTSGCSITGTLNLGSGDLTLTGNINMSDSSGGGNNRLIFGVGDDLQMWHDGSDSYIADEGTGALRILSNLFRVNNAANDEAMIKAEENGAVTLSHNGSDKFRTSSTGMQLEGDALIDRSGNSNTPVIQVTNSSYAKSLYIGGWSESNTNGVSRIRNSNNNLHIDSGSIGQIYLNAYCSGEIRARHQRPLTDNTYDLGSSSLRWDDVYATNTSIQSSDRNKKNTIVDSDLGLSFIEKLKPVSYKFNSGTRTHYGLIAQDVETVLSDISKSTTDFAGFVKTDLPDEYYQEAEPHIPDGKKEGDLKSAAHSEYGLRYGEFISPLIKAVQELSAKNEALEARIKTLEG